MLLLLLLSVDLRLNLLTTESPDLVRCLTNIVNLCFPDNHYDLFNHADGRSATSPLVLITVFQRLQYFVAGGSTYRLRSIVIDAIVTQNIVYMYV